MPEHVNDALLKGLSKKREDRYDNCKEFVRALIAKPTATDSPENTERKFPEGAVLVNDLPSDQRSGETPPPVWLPAGLSALPSGPSSQPPVVVKPKHGLPSWVWPTVSALAMLVICLFFFLGYVVTDKKAKPEQPIAVAKTAEPKDEDSAEAVPVQEEKAEPENDVPMEKTEETAQPEKVAEEESQPDAPPFKSGFKNIFEAVEKGTLPDVEYFVNNGDDVNRKYGDGNTLLHAAAWGNPDAEVLKYLISQGADVHAKKNDGLTPLGAAKTEEKRAILRAAMTEKKPPTVSPSGFKDIFEAARKGTVRDIEHFLKNGADINSQNNNDEDNAPLHEAAHFNTNVEVLKYIIAQGGDIRGKNKRGRLPQDFAAADNPNIEVLKYFISLGADIKTQNYAGRTMLQEAALFNRNVEVLKYLVSQGADVNGKIRSGMIPLHIAAWGNPSVEVLEFLVSQCSDINVQSNDGKTALHEAAKNNRNTDILKYLISQGANIHAKNKDDKTPLDLADTEEKKAILREAMVPAEAAKLRKQYEEAVKQAQTPYREELEKELALAKKQNNLQLVATLEAEQKHLDSEDAEELSAFTPEKRSLLNAKVRYKKQFETARDAYLKEMDLLAKELVRDARTNDALFVQNEVDRIRNRLNERNHLGEQKLSLIRPKRSQFAPVPVIRMTMELHADGKGRCGISRGMSTDSPEPLFPGMAFPLSAFPKAQAFRGPNGMGRVVFDFRDADPKTTWDASGWGRMFNHMEIDAKRKTLRFESSKLEASQRGSRALFSPGKFSDLPFRVTIEAVVNQKSYLPILYLGLTNRQGEYSHISMWKRPAERLASSHYRRFLQDKTSSDTDILNIEIGDKQPIWAFFELPKVTVENLAHVHYSVEAGNESTNLPPRLDLDVEVVLLDISGKLKATTGFSVAKTDEKVMIGNVSPQAAAFRTGLKVGDEIVRFNGEKRTVEQIQKALDEVQFGDPIAVAVIRNGEEKVFRFHAE